MDLYPDKVTDAEGAERFVLVDAKTQKVVTAKDVSEATVRKFFQKHGASETAINEALRRARKRFDQKQEAAATEASNDDFFDDLMDDFSSDE
ncbi:hypothetical protein [Lignipirellula cremea]|uniref:Uncharacterized protein n=1 Tax=Lignipirellula cremea TaxID=2528010 RepID=A0A518E1X4_9BACT|nr:hypothetical protein [Lignipirellula cremea]QDU98072.1 hypothetical protein Pla8534_59330 [Lignipirellula cremea]